MFKSSYRIAKVMGIPIELHISLAVPLIAVAAMSIYYKEPMLALLLALVFGSVVLHELGHSFVAIRKGCRVQKITLMIIGGVARIDRIPDKPSGEILMAIAGPMVSMCLAALGFTAAIYLQRREYIVYASYANYFASTNAVLAVLNMVPAFPMDGGRILRAALTPRFGRLRATQVASRIGKLLAVAVIFFSFNHLLDIHADPLHTTDQLVQPFMLIAISIFIYRAASREYNDVRRQEIKKRGPASFWEAISMIMHPEAPPEDEPEDEDKVVISPPPYERKGRNSKADIHSSRDAGFR